MNHSTRTLWIGTYPAAGAGTPTGVGEGIWSVQLDAATSALSHARLAAATPAPSFVATHPGGRVVYAVGEQQAGTVTAFAAGPGGELGALAVVSSGGADPCHLLVSADARTLYVTNYSSGTVGVLPLDADGAFARETLAAGGPLQVLGHSGSGPDAARQEGPHAHFAALAPGGAHLLVVDLGTDELRRYRIDAGGRLTVDGIAATLPPGTGPRHLVVGPDPDGHGELIYLLGELDVTVRVLRWDRASATAALVQTLPACRTPLPSGLRAYPAHVTLDAGVLRVSVREADVIATFAVDQSTGLLDPIAELDAGGRWPRNFARVDGVTIAAAQLGHAVRVLADVAAPAETVDPSSPAATAAPSSSAATAAPSSSAAPPPRASGVVAIPSPACVTPAA